nr:MAG TPA: hypothetical protein [Bacteriophage sp.]
MKSPITQKVSPQKSFPFGRNTFYLHLYSRNV